MRCEGVFRHNKDGDPRATKFEEFAACQVEFMEGSGTKFEAFRFGSEPLSHGVHRARSCIIKAACCTASMMRVCVPHRQMFPWRN